MTLLKVFHTLIKVVFSIQLLPNFVYIVGIRKLHSKCELCGFHIEAEILSLKNVETL